ncbi:MAG: hypothetical protein ACAH80_12240 [Alphaproteobacteria bacterium]
MDRKLDRKLDGKAKIFSLDQDDLWIEALVPAEAGMGPSESISFQVSSIAHVKSLGEKHTVIALNNGPEITLSIAKQDFMERMNSGEAGETLDLKAVSVTEDKNELMKRLRTEFKEAQELAKHAEFNKFTFTAFVRAPQQKEFVEFTFSGADVYPDKISEGGSIMGGQALTFVMRRPGKGPFEGGQFMIETTIEEFNAMCRMARDKSENRLDLREYSMRKGTLTSEERAARDVPLKRGPQP